MGTFNGNKKPPYFLTDDNLSPDSLSFSGLVSIQNQQSKSPSSVPLNQTKQHDQTTNQSPEFEFIVTKATPKSAAANSVKKTKPEPTNLLISIEQLQQQQAISFQSNHTDHHHHNFSLSSLLSAQSHHGNGQRLSSGNTRKFDGVEKGTRPRSKSSAGRFFETLVSPCRKCRAVEPKVKVH